MAEQDKHMMPPSSSKSYNEFERESHRIDELVWAAMAISPKSRALFLGFENSREVILRALRDDVHITVIESHPHAIREAEALGIDVVRASASGLPFKADTFDIAVAHYYLHEIDPAFHSQVAFELSRVARRISLIEPGPPADLLGSRIAGLYARAKRDQGQFEQYQSMEYWRKLLSGVRSVVVPLTVLYGSLPPRAFLRDTMRMMLDLMKIGGVSPSDLTEMRALAGASDVQMLPQPRYVLLAASSLAEIPDRPRIHDLEQLAPNRMRERAVEEAYQARRSRMPSAKKLPPEPAGQPLHHEAPVESLPIAPVAPSFVPPTMVEAIAPTAARAVPVRRQAKQATSTAATPAAAFNPKTAFGVPPIPASDEPVESLFKKRPGKTPAASSNWDNNDPAEMPDFGIPR